MATTVGPQKLWIDAVTDTSSTAKYQLGTVREEGGNTYVYVVDSGSAITAGYCCYYSGTNYEVSVLITSTATGSHNHVLFKGVMQNALSTSYYGWLMVEGRGIVAVGTNTLANVMVYSDATAGLIGPTSTNTAIYGIVVHTAAGATATTTGCYINKR